MNVLFLTLIDLKDISQKGIYQDLIREFIARGHSVYAVSPTERRNKEKTHVNHDGNFHSLKVKTLNVQKTNVVEKVLSTLMIEGQFKSAIKKQFKGVKFDLIVYSTPPITFGKVVRYFKKRDGAKTYLLLKDIFPQNAVDLGMMSKSGIKGFVYRYFRNKEKTLYLTSDFIGCMSQANVEYVLKENPWLDEQKVEVCPNSLELVPKEFNQSKAEIREKYGISLDKTVFVYGGNLGKPQCVDFIIECLKKCKENEKAFFVIAGSGTEYYKLKNFVESDSPKNVSLINYLPAKEYEALTSACDVGLIFLDKRFTIPNFPSRLLSYMTASMPVFACTDKNTDIGKVITENGFGWWIESSSAEQFYETIKKICEERNLDVLGERAFECFLKNYQVKDAVDTILRRVQ